MNPQCQIRLLSPLQAEMLSFKIVSEGERSLEFRIRESPRSGAIALAVRL
jgi:hypothetical protein